jgi:predicted dehydrogenase
MQDFFKAAPNYNARMTAICDIWNKRREAAAARVKEVHGTEPKVYRHIEELLSDKDIDAVIIATADHQHAQMLKMAVEAGKDVYVEKPMANVLEEANATLAAVKKSGRIVQNGTQRRCYPKYRQAEKLMRQGVLGDVVKVDLNVNFYSPYRWAHKPEQLAEVREADTDWKAFLLGKPYRPFDPKIYRSFRLFREFSSGIIDQWMTHLIDIVHFLTGYPIQTAQSLTAGFTRIVTIETILTTSRLSGIRSRRQTVSGDLCNLFDQWSWQLRPCVRDSGHPGSGRCLAVVRGRQQSARPDSDGSGNW